ncbi:MAG: sugar phosphate isomerase/epimerase [Propionibacteriaceae bacterium]|jgi:sugar phosphate isomerase/epimerase|nr:sugar phosphate isomerase/epimerase [Propionibacteriaceae bacterium]
MKIGFVSAILDGWEFPEVVTVAKKQGYGCVEVACWPSGVAERRYAGVTHIDVSSLTEGKIADIHGLLAESGVAISSLAFYPNPLDPVGGEAAITHLKKTIAASAALGVNLVTTFIGRDQRLSVAENLKLMRKVWPDILRLAADAGVRIAIENCPMLFGADQWPGGQNLFTTPAIWSEVFALLDSAALGLNYDPSHFVWQQMDPIKPIYDFAEKLLHVHIKDIRVDRYRLDQVGIMAYPLDYMSPKLPGHGDIDWGAFISALDDVGYTGPVCVEVEDRAYESSPERILESLELSKRYIDQFII